MDLFKLYEPMGGDHFNIFAAGLKTADRVITVSRGYAWELTTSEGGWGLHEIINENNWKFRGIVNGIDTVDWNPELDLHLQSDGYRNYSIETLRKPGNHSARRRCRRSSASLSARTSPHRIHRPAGSPEGRRPHCGCDALDRRAGLAAGDAGHRAGRPGGDAAQVRQGAPQQGEGVGGVLGEDGAQDHRRGGRPAHAIAVRALRAEPAVRHEVRHGPGGARRRRASRHGDPVRSLQGERVRVDVRPGGGQQADQCAGELPSTPTGTRRRIGRACRREGWRRT
ncbi:unnamed protein product [Musa acuminata subsp. malaccensis]|uniref:(wild Malaysian banana) hypothetical protein n=1 Tax=Musa acuminata subsp. malaccensis TaxID=214687 RepID=A0A8D6ZP68_MUSAM|nr:unnamed protein product [Musa acuminata subsp. malaccensis]